MAGITVIPTGGSVPIALEDLAATVVALQGDVTALQAVAIVPAVAINYVTVDSENNRVLFGAVKVDGSIGSVSIKVNSDAPFLVLTNIGDGGGITGLLTPLPSIGDHTLTVTAITSAATATMAFTV